MKKRLSNEARERKQRLKNAVCPLDGGTPALNFVNTLRNRGSENHKDFLGDYEGFVIWCNHAEVIDDDHFSVLNLEGYCYFTEAAEVFERVISARHSLYQVFLSVIKGVPANEAYMRHFNSLVDNASKHLQYVSTAKGVQHVWVNIQEEISAPLHIIVLWAAELLTNRNQKKIKQCPTCGSLFYDRTKNGTRRWCNQNTCGHLPRAKQYYHAKKAMSAGQLVISSSKLAI